MHEESEMQYKLIVTESGEQIPTSFSQGMKLSVIIPNDPVDKEMALDLTSAEFVDLQEKAATNSIDDVILKEKGTQ